MKIKNLLPVFLFVAMTPIHTVVQKLDTPKHSESMPEREIQVIFRLMSGENLDTIHMISNGTIFYARQALMNKKPYNIPCFMIEGKTDILNEQLVLGDLIAPGSDSIILTTVLEPTHDEFWANKWGCWIEESFPLLRDCTLTINSSKSRYSSSVLDLLEIRVCDDKEKEIVFARLWDEADSYSRPDQVQKWHNKNGNVHLDQFIRKYEGIIRCKMPVRTVYIMIFEAFLKELFNGKIKAIFTTCSGHSKDSRNIVAPTSLRDFFTLIEAEFERADKVE